MIDKRWALEKAFQAAKDYDGWEYQDKVEDLILAAGKIEEYLEEKPSSEDLEEYISGWVAIAVNHPNDQTPKQIARSILKKLDVGFKQ